MVVVGEYGAIGIFFFFLFVVVVAGTTRQVVVHNVQGDRDGHHDGCGVIVIFVVVVVA